uniref:Uncharacterized protein n=2 Tax=Lutzomyia longipalpis TaxID=7200 RepID=A0A1B0GJ53_LUTLO
MDLSEMESHCYVSHTFNMLRYIDCHKCVKDILTQSKDIQIPKAHSIRELIANSDEMGLRFPNERYRLRNQPPSSHPSIKEEASSVYPFVFENVFVLFCKFLEHKLKYGSEIEKDIYSGMKIEDFVERLLVKRCVSFFGKKNRFLLRTGEIGNDNFKLIGTDDEEPPLVMRDYLTLDEIKLASFISISSRSKNQVTIGICSLQLDKKGLMDYQDIILGKSQNCQENGYGPKPKKNCSEEMEKNFHRRSLWNDFYSHKSPIYGQIDKKGVQCTSY